MPNSLIEERDERTRKRKKIKRKFDAIIGLSYHDEEHKAVSLSVNGTLTGTTARLLDEGYCDNGFILKKGTLEKFLNGQNQYVRGWELGENGWERTEVLNLDSDFVGTVNLGHMDFATMPFILGEWNRDDLSLVDIENDRKALDIDMRLDEESMFVKELRRQNHDIGVSAEFWYHVNDADTEELTETLGMYLPVIDEIFIFAYGLVGECGNVNSSGLELKGEKIMPQDINEVLDTEEVEETEEIELMADTEVVEEATTEAEEAVELAEDVSEAVEAVEEEVEEAEADEVAEDEAEEAEEEVEIGEEGEVEEVGEEADDEDEADEAEDGFEELLAEITQLRNRNAELEAQVTELTNANAELKKSNRRLNSKLQNEKDKKDKFLASAKGISAKLFPNEDAKPTEKKVTEDAYLFGDGIGEI